MFLPDLISVINVFNCTAHIVYSPLNSYFYIHCILDIKYILLLLYKGICCYTKVYVVIQRYMLLYKGICCYINVFAHRTGWPGGRIMD